MNMLGALAADSTGYRLLLFGHLLCVIIGFGSTFVYPIIGNHASKVRGVGAAEISNASEKSGKFLTEPFILGAGAFGIAMAATGSAYDFGTKFVQMALGIYVVALVFSFGVHIPNLAKMNKLANELAAMGPPPAGASGPPPQAAEMEKRGNDARRNGGILSLLFVVILVLMVWKPL